MKVFLLILGILILAVAAAVLYFMLSPMPVVRFLRKQPGELPTMPAGCEAAENVEVVRDLKYASEWPQNTYDLFLPAGRDKSPLVLWVHGGAFVAGDKAGTENWGILLADRGYAVMSINYCHAPGSRLSRADPAGCRCLQGNRQQGICRADRL